MNETRITAGEARARLNAAIGTVADVAPLLAVAYRAIAHAVADRRDHIGDPFCGLRTPISPAQRAAVWEQLRRDGYDVAPGDPRKPDLVVIRW